MPSESTSKHTQGRDEEQAVIRCLFERVYSTGELSRVTDLVASDCIGYSTESAKAYLRPEGIKTHVYHGPEGIKTHVSRLRAAFHGFTVEIDDCNVKGDTFEVAWIVRGTHERRFLGIGPTCTIGQAGEEPHGDCIAVPGVATGTIRNGEIHESWMVWDVETLQHQLGASGRDADTGSRESTTQKSHKVNHVHPDTR